MGWDRGSKSEWGTPPPFLTPGMVLGGLALAALIVAVCGFSQ